MAALRVDIEKDADIRLEYARAVEVHIDDPLPVLPHRLIGDGRIVISVAHDVDSRFKRLFYAVDGVHIVRHAVREEKRGELRRCALPCAAEHISYHTAGHRLGGLGGRIHIPALRLEISAKQSRLGALAGAVKSLDYNKFSSHNTR